MFSETGSNLAKTGNFNNFEFEIYLSGFAILFIFFSFLQDGEDLGETEEMKAANTVLSEAEAVIEAN